MTPYSTETKSTKGILLVHGLTGTPTEMKLLGRALKHVGFKVDIPLLAGHGRTSKELLDTQYEDWLGTVQQHYNAMLEHCEEVYIVGLCMGGMLGLLLASDPKLAKPPAGIVVMGPHLDYFSENNSNLRFILPLLYKLPIPRFISDNLFWTEEPPYGLRDERLINKITQEIQKSSDTAHGTFRTYLTSFRQMNRLNKTIKKKLSQVTCPVLLIQSIEDSFLSPKNSLRLYQLLGSTQKQILFLNGTDHMLPIDLRKKEVWHWIHQFVSTRNVLDAFNQNATETIETDLNRDHYEMILNAKNAHINWLEQEIQVYHHGKLIATISASINKKEPLPLELHQVLEILSGYIKKIAPGEYNQELCLANITA